MVGVTGFLPIGYYKDEEKTAKTFPVIDGVRYSIPGDWVRVEEDGSLTLLGHVMERVHPLTAVDGNGTTHCQRPAEEGDAQQLPLQYPGLGGEDGLKRYGFPG